MTLPPSPALPPPRLTFPAWPEIASPQTTGRLGVVIESGDTNRRAVDSSSGCVDDKEWMWHEEGILLAGACKPSEIELGTHTHTHPHTYTYT